MNSTEHYEPPLLSDQLRAYAVNCPIYEAMWRAIRVLTPTDRIIDLLELVSEGDSELAIELLREALHESCSRN